MALRDLLDRTNSPGPWAEGDKIPWNDAEFSRRMLNEHLAQNHDLASRRYDVIDRQVDWIHRVLLKQHPNRVLDLGCGPGLYSSRLAALGHTCVGIDFSPAAIDYARKQAPAGSSACRYVLGDLRQVDFGSGFDLAMLIFGELNMFRREDALNILLKARNALAPGGQLLIEAHTFAAVEAIGRAAPSWRTSRAGLFSERPHLILEEGFWHEKCHVATHRTYVVDVETSEVTRYVETAQAYTDHEYRDLLEGTGFKLDQSLPTLPGSPPSDDFVVLVARTYDETTREGGTRMIVK